MRTDGDSTCTYSGNYGQTGRFGDWKGSVTCSDGFAGTFAADRIEVTSLSVSGFISAQSSVPSCSWSGAFAGVRRVSP
jgi:hypothetical protein